MKKARLLLAVAGCVCGLWSSARASESAPVLMIGDSMMRLLGVAMEKELKASGIEPASSFTSLGSGLARLDAFDWFAKVDELMAERKPATVVVTLGANDRQSLKDAGGQIVQLNTPEWTTEYASRIGHVMDQLLKGGATRVIWLLLPDMKDPVQQEYAKQVNEIVTQQAATPERKDHVLLYDTRPLLTRRPGTFSMYVMAPNGAALTVRDTDGIHLTRPGAERIAEALVKTYWKK